MNEELIEKQVRDWAIDFISFYRTIGFLSQAEMLSNEGFVQLLMEWDEDLSDVFKGVETVMDECDFFIDVFEEEDYELLPKTTQLYDLRVLALLDPLRLWWRWRDNDYAAMIQRWADISRGSFPAKEITETKKDNNQSLIGFTLHDKKLEYTVSYKGVETAEEKEVLPEAKQLRDIINPLIIETGSQFESMRVSLTKEYVPFNITEYAVALTEEDKKQIAEKRDWSFTYD